MSFDMSSKKKGFLKLSGEEVAALDEDESGSEIELLDVTQLNGAIAPKEPGAMHSRRRRGSCCGCYVAFYLFLVTMAIALIALFTLFVAYNVQLLKQRMIDMDTEMDKLRADLESLSELHEKDLSLYSSNLRSLGANLTRLTSLVTGLTGRADQLESKLGEMKQDAQLSGNDWIQLLAKNMTAMNVDMKNLASSVAHSSSIIDSLQNQFAETKKYCGDFGTQIEAITTKSGDTVDAVQVLKTELKARNHYIDSYLLGLSYFKGNTTETLKQLSWAANVTLDELVTSILNLSEASSLDHLHKLTELQVEINKLKETLVNVQVQLQNLSEAMTTPTQSNSNGKATSVHLKTTPKATPIVSSKATPKITPMVTSKATPTATSKNKPVSSSSVAHANQSLSPSPTASAVTAAAIETVIPNPLNTNESENGTDPAPDTPTSESGETDKASRAEAVLKKILESFDALDVDGDTELSMTELESYIKSAKVFSLLDKDKSGGVSMDELRQSIEFVQHNHAHDDDTKTELPAGDDADGTDGDSH